MTYRLATIHPLQTDGQGDRQTTHRAIDALDYRIAVMHQKCNIGFFFSC